MSPDPGGWVADKRVTAKSPSCLQKQSLWWGVEGLPRPMGSELSWSPVPLPGSPGWCHMAPCAMEQVATGDAPLTRVCSLHPLKSRGKTATSVELTTG